MRHLDPPAELELATSVTALLALMSEPVAASPYADRAPSSNARRVVAEDWFIESVRRLAVQRRRSYASAADALLSIRRDVRLALESSAMPAAVAQPLLERATDVAVDVLLSPRTSGAGGMRHD